MRHPKPGSKGPRRVRIANENSSNNYIHGDGNITNSSSIYNYIVVPEVAPDTIAIIEKRLGQHHCARAVFEAQSINAGCMPGTRVQFLEQVLAVLTARTRGPHIAWISGMAGTGKTALALTLCRMLEDEATILLGGSFFCSRSTGTIERTDVQRIAPTLATLIARQLPNYASALAEQLRGYPDIAHWSVRSQVERLLTRPLAELESYDGQIVFVIDALDECSDQAKLAELIDALAGFKGTLPVKFLLTSRPEMYIRRTPINDPDLSTILQLHTIDPTHIEGDMRLYIGETLARGSGTTAWYAQSDVEAIVQLSCGLFIFASTVLRYILDRSYDEGRKERLRKVISSVSRDTASTAPLDQIYELVLTEASRKDKVDVEELEDTKRVVACILTARASLSVQALADLIMTNPGSLRGALERLPSLVHVPDNDTEPGIRTLHASFGDYMFDRAAAHVRIDSTFGHNVLARGCLRRMNSDDLHFNISRSRSSFEPNPDDALDWISASLIYACLHWAHHIDASPDSSAFADEVDRTFRRKLLFWLELLSITNKMNVASGLLRIAGSAVKLPEVARFLRDANSFVASSYDAIARSAPHIYISAIPFAPKDSLVYQNFGHRCTGVVSVQTFGIDRHGGSLVMTLTGHEESVTLVVHSRDGRLLMSGSEDGNVRVWDTHTGEETMALIRASSQQHRICAIAFVPSRNGVAMCTSDGILRIQDVTTGRELLYQLHDFPCLIVCAAFSPDGKLLVAGLRDGTVCLWSTLTGKSSFVLTGPTNNIESVTKVVFSPNGRLVGSTLGIRNTL